LSYSIKDIDSRFGVSRASVEAALIDAETIWEEASGKDLFVLVPEGGIAVSFVYGDEQKANELGNVIDAEQAAYDAKKDELEDLKRVYTRAQTSFDARAESFDARAAAYHAEVARWNSQGGAPPEEYAALQQEQQELQEEQAELQKLVERVNSAAEALNEAVDELNVLANKVNAKVERYNEHAGDAFDQGDYQEDAEGKRISVYEFNDATDLRRVLTHEFGHALGIGHVESPDSVMYSFNAGSSLTLSEEDVVALNAVCGLD